METNLLLLGLALPIAVAGTAIASALVLRVRSERERVSALQGDLHALCVASLKLAERLEEVERRVGKLALKQDELGLLRRQRVGDGESLEQATKLARKGASVEEVMDICNISRGEAELVAMMQRLET